MHPLWYESSITYFKGTVRIITSRSIADRPKHVRIVARAQFFPLMQRYNRHYHVVSYCAMQDRLPVVFSRFWEWQKVWKSVNIWRSKGVQLNYAKGDYVGLCKHMDIDWDWELCLAQYNNIEDMWTAFKGHFLEGIEQHIPKISKFHDWRRPSWKCPPGVATRLKNWGGTGRTRGAEVERCRARIEGAKRVGVGVGCRV